MAYTREKGREFWYDLDNQTLFRRTPEVTDALSRAYFDHGMTFDSAMESLRASFAAPNHPEPFIATVSPGKGGFVDLAGIQFELMQAHLDDPSGIQAAFEDFGQGVLYDDRPPRPTGRKVHMMDGTIDTWVGFHRWHAFARSVALLAGNNEPWLHVNRCIALAWAIQTEADPQQDHPNNPGLTEERLAPLRRVWMSMSAKRLDWAFVNHRFRAPSPNEVAGRYRQVQELLDEAAGTLQPFHDNHSRFWELPYAEFMALPPIYDVQLIADEGPDRGARSGLVRVLRGEVPDIPQMPLNRPPMDAADITFIQEWIDDGCPEE